MRSLTVAYKGTNFAEPKWLTKERELAESIAVYGKTKLAKSRHRVADSAVPRRSTEAAETP